MFDFIIIGAGITGVTIGRLLQQLGENNFIILEADSEPGGLCRTQQIGDHVLDIGGGHFLCSKYQEVYDFIFSHIGKEEFNYFNRVSKIEIDRSIIDYPLESNIWQLPVDQQVEYLLSTFKSGEVNGENPPANYERYIRWKLGNLIAEQYMLPYNSKLWGVQPEEMDVDWLHKIPSINAKEILYYCLTHQADLNKMPSHAGFYYPKFGGFQTIFDAIYKHIGKFTKVNSPVTKLEYKNDHWVVNEEFLGKKVINTAPWPNLYKALGSPAELENQFAKLQSNSLVVSLWEEEYDHDFHWMYVPDVSKEWHREFYIHNFAPHSARKGLYTETNLKRRPKSGQFWHDGSKPIFEYINKSAYPIPVLGHAEAIKEILAVYSEKSLYGVGRWGQWQYLNADVCIREAFKFVEAL